MPRGPSIPIHCGREVTRYALTLVKAVAEVTLPVGAAARRRLGEPTRRLAQILPRALTVSIAEANVELRNLMPGPRGSQVVAKGSFQIPADSKAPVEAHAQVEQRPHLALRGRDAQLPRRLSPLRNPAAPVGQAIRQAELRIGIT